MIEEHSNHPLTLLPTQPSLSTLNLQKRKREICQTQITLPTPSSSSSSSLSFQLQPKTPPNFLQRMKTDTCFHCKQQGHWSEYCPLKPQNKNIHKSHSSSLHDQIYCRCGHGFCLVKISSTTRNPRRNFFVCPIKRGPPCEYFKWCDDPIEETYFHPPFFKYPFCECGAGVCKKVKHYFVCPIKKDHGSCGFRVSEEELLNNINTSIVPFQQPSQRPLDEILEGSQNDSIYKDMTEGGDLLLTTKKMRIVDNLENHSPAVAVSDTPMVKEGEPPIKEVNSQHIGFPDFEFDDDDLDFTKVPLEAIVDKALVPSCLSTPSRISHRQSLFKSDMDSSPSQSLKFPQPRPVFCCIFPSLDSIVVPEQAGTPNSGQFSTITHLVASKDLISPNKSPISKAQRQRVVALFTQQQLLNDLENFDPHQHDLMREAAETTFAMLDLLGFECKQFSDHIWDFINHVSSMAEIDKSMENSPTLEAHNRFLEEEKVKLAHIHANYIKTEASFEALNQQKKSLSEEVRHIETMLHEKRKALKSCELETMKIETHLCDLKRNMLDADTTLKDRGRQAEAAREKSADRHTKQIAAETTLEMAKWVLDRELVIT